MSRLRFTWFLVLMMVLVVGNQVSAYEPMPENPGLREVFRSFPPADGDVNTRVRLLTENDQAWYARWKLLSEAKRTIVSTYFIVDQDIFGLSFLGLLQKKAREGVRIKLMIDDRFLRGAKKLSDYDELQELARMPGVEIRLYNPIGRALLPAFLDLRRVLASNHDKIIIIDDDLCMTGGRNIGRDYFVQFGENPNVFADNDLILRGKSVTAQLQLAFDEEWNSLKTKMVKPDLINFRSQAARLDLAYRVMNQYLLGQGTMDPAKMQNAHDLAKALMIFNTEITRYKKLSGYAGFDLFRGERVKPVKILDKHSMFGNREDIGPNLVRMIDACRSEILIQNAYVVLSPAAEEALKRASARGVKIVLNTNSGASTNHQSTVAFFMNDWKRLLATMPTARILVFPAGQPCLHTKAFVFDRQVAVIGTYNLDPLSDVINSEVVAVIADAPFAQMTALRMEKQFARCLEYKVSIGADGRIQTVFGPEDHLQEEVVKKLNLFRKLQWLRPLI